MIQEEQGLFRSQTSTSQFLFYKTDSNLKDDKIGTTSSADSDELSKAFPDIFTGKSFIDHAMSRLKSSLKFGAMAIRIDNFSQNNVASGRNRAADISLDVAKTINGICKSENGMWGQIDTDIFGCFFPETGDTSCLKLAENIRKNIAEHTDKTVTIGIASYPTINFNKSQILDNACKALNHATFFGPDSIVSFDAVSLNISGDQLYQNGDIEGAIEEFKTALVLDPSNVNVHNSLGVCYGVLGSYKKALEEFETAIGLDPNEVMTLYNAGLVNMLTDNKDKALEYFLKAYATEKEVFEVALQIGRVYLEKGEPENGKKFLEKSTRLRPDSGSAFRYLGECYVAIDMTDEAISAYKKAIKQNPNDAASLSAVGYLFGKKGEDPEIATIFCEQSIEISPENGLFRHRLAKLYLSQNRFEEALAEFQKATKLGHDSSRFVEQLQNLKLDT